MNTLPIRLSYLLRPDLTASIKLVWLTLQMDRNLNHRLLYSPTRIQRLCGVSRPTIRKALGRLKAPWRPQVALPHRGLSQKQIRVNTGLITDTSLPSMARVIYCLLLGLDRFPKKKRPSSYVAIAKVAHVQPRTIRLAVRALVNAGWLAVKQANQQAPLSFSFPNPKRAQRRAELRRAKQRLKKSEFYGETLALLWCDTLVDSTNYQDDYFPRAFTNPETRELLQADRYYFDHNVAIEFDGPQHEGPTLLFPVEVTEAQIARDRTKQAICERQKIALITLRPEDLTYKNMQEVLGRVLPLREMSGNEPVVNYLQSQSRIYLKYIQQIRLQAHQVRPSTSASA